MEGCAVRHHRYLQRFTLTACLACIAYLLLFFAFAVIPIVPYLKVDLALIPILFGFFVLGPQWGCGVIALQAAVYFVLTGPSVGHLIGVLSNVLAALAFCLPFYWIMRPCAQRGKPFWMREGMALVAGTVVMTGVMSLANWLVLTPLYINVIGMRLALPLPKLVLFGIIPFNLIKGVIVGGCFVVLYHYTARWVLRERQRLEK